MTVKELKEKLSQYPYDMLVGDVGHFGEYLDIYEIHQFDCRSAEGEYSVVRLCIDSKGEEPD